MIKENALRLVILVAVVVKLLIIFLVWNYQAMRYEQKLTAQENNFLVVQQTLQDKHLNQLKEQNKLSQEKTEEYKRAIKDLNDEISQFSVVNVELTNSIASLRKQEGNLRTTINNLSQQTLREYALVSSTAIHEIAGALEREQRASQEASAEADRYYAGYKALDEAWPEAKE